MKEKQKELMTNLVRSNLLASTGCTEPIAIAYAAAVARTYLKGDVSKIRLSISKNMAKNAMDAGIPNSKFTGAGFAVSLGALFANPDNGFQLLENLSAFEYEIAKKFAKDNVTIEISNESQALYIEVELLGDEKGRCCKDFVRVIIANSHTNISLIEVNGIVIFKENLHKDDSTAETTENIEFSIKEVFEYADNLNDLSIFKNAIDMNMNLSRAGKNSDWGLNVGKTKPFYEESSLSRIISTTTSAVDARMAGAPYPAMACTGSGNQGISTTIPVFQFGVEIGASKEKILRAVAISDLTAIYVKRNLNVLSYLCGAVIANCGASSGMTYLLGGTYKEAEYAVKNVLASVTGMFCDGAKSTCSLKVLACATIAVYSAYMAINSKSRIKQKVGIACESLRDTIKNVAKLEQETSQIMDDSIMRIIMK